MACTSPAVQVSGTVSLISSASNVRRNDGLVACVVSLVSRVVVVVCRALALATFVVPHPPGPVLSRVIGLCRAPQCSGGTVFCVGTDKCR